MGPGESSQELAGEVFSNSTDTSDSSSSFNRTAEIPSFLRPFLHDAAFAGSSSLRDLTNLSGGDLAADFNADQTQSFDLARDVALGGGGFLPTSLDALNATARGDFLFGGDGFNAAVGAAENRIIPNVISRFGGRGGSGLASAAAADEIGDAFASQFSQERGRQLNAAQLLPGMALLPSEILSQIGGVQQAQAQREIDAPLNAQSRLFQLASGALPFGSLIGQSGTTNSNSTTTSTGNTQQFEPLFEGDPIAGGLGGALTGAQIGSAIMPGIGSGIGAIGGGLLGAFG